MNVDTFDFDLPEALIALRPVSPRHASRMLVVHPDGRLEHRHVADLPEYLRAPDTLLVNDSRVIPARLRGQRLRESESAKIEVLLHRRLAADRYAALVRPARKLAPGDTLVFGDLTAEVMVRGEGGETEIRFGVSGAALDAAVTASGEMPLPPYIAGKRPADARDAQDYQTMFSRSVGSVAAPTAGLHFTPELMAALRSRSVGCEALTLHVGLGTFLPVTAEDTSAHRMHAEYASLTAAVARRLNEVHDAGGRIACVGTTSLRTLESAAGEDGRIAPLDADIGIFITPGYRFRAADILLTNFHLPRSTLFMLVSAFMGLETMRHAYAAAIREKYRFYSYGDACLLLRAS